MCKPGGIRCAAASSQGCGDARIYEARKNNRTYRRDLAKAVREQGNHELAKKIMKAKFVSMPELTEAAGFEPGDISDASLPGLVKTHHISSEDKALIQELTQANSPHSAEQDDALRPIPSGSDIKGWAPEAYASKLFRIDREIEEMHQEMYYKGPITDERKAELLHKSNLFRRDRDRLAVAAARADAYLDYEWSQDKEDQYQAEIAKVRAIVEGEEAAPQDDAANVERVLTDPAYMVNNPDAVRSISTQDLAAAWDRFQSDTSPEADQARALLTQIASERGGAPAQTDPAPAVEETTPVEEVAPEPVAEETAPVTDPEPVDEDQPLYLRARTDRAARSKWARSLNTTPELIEAADEDSLNEMKETLSLGATGSDAAISKIDAELERRNAAKSPVVEADAMVPEMPEDFSAYEAEDSTVVENTRTGAWWTVRIGDGEISIHGRNGRPIRSGTASWDLVLGAARAFHAANA